MPIHEHVGAGDRIHERSKGLGVEFASEVADRLQQLLDERDIERSKAGKILMAPEWAEAEIESVRAQAYDHFLQERYLGFRNDRRSIAPGLTALITEAAKTRFEASIGGKRISFTPEEQESLIAEAKKIGITLQPMPQPDEYEAALAGRHLSALPPFFSPAPEAGAAGLFVMSLPRGFYSEQGIHTKRDAINDVMFYTGGSVDRDGNFGDLYGGFRLAAQDIVWIHGDVGELLQNPRYNTDGSVRNKPAA